MAHVLRALSRQRGALARITLRQWRAPVFPFAVQRFHTHRAQPMAQLCAPAVYSHIPTRLFSSGEQTVRQASEGTEEESRVRDREVDMREESETEVQLGEKEVSELFEYSVRVLGSSVAPDEKRTALEDLEKLANEGNVEAKAIVGSFYHDGQIVLRDVKKAVALMQEAAEAGFSKAMVLLAMYYEEGHGVEMSVPTAKSWYEKAAEENNSEAILRLARAYEYPEDHLCDADVRKAMDMYMKADELGSDVASLKLGLLHEAGAASLRKKKNEGSKIKEEELRSLQDLAEKYFERAASKGNPIAQHHYAMICLQKAVDLDPKLKKLRRLLENTTGADRKKAKKHARKLKEEHEVLTERGVYLLESSAKDYLPATVSLAECYRTGFGVEEDHKKAVSLFERAAAAGDLAAKHLYGLWMIQSDDEKTASRGLTYLEEAASDGYLQSQLSLAVVWLRSFRESEESASASLYYAKRAVKEHNSDQGMLLLGEIAALKGNEERAKKWLTRASEAGNSAATVKLAAMNLDSADEEQKKEGFALMVAAAKKNNPQAAFHVAMSYYRGEGVQEDADRAHQWMFASAQLRHAEALFCLGVWYSGGIGVEKDAPRGFKFFHAAAQKGHARSCYCLAQMLNSGEGVAADPKKAKEWLQIAAELGMPEARSALEADKAAMAKAKEEAKKEAKEKAKE